MNIETAPDNFTVHEAVHSWLTRGGDFTIAGESFLKLNPIRRDRLFAGAEARMEFEACLIDKHWWARAAVSLRDSDPVADVWFWLGYGTTATSLPRLSRRAIPVGDTLNGAEQDFGLLDVTHSVKVLHGEATVPLHLLYDFRDGTFAVSPRPDNFTASKLVPRDGNDTGGHYPYMGLTIVGANWTIEDCRREFYPAAGYGGHFVFGADGATPPGKPGAPGEMVSEAHWPAAVLANGAHFHRDTPTWIRYSDPKNPWQDRALMRNPDDQHFSVWEGPAEAGAKYPWDIAMRWINLHACHRFLGQIPGRDKGTYQWDPGAGRSRGRIIKYACAALEMLEPLGLPALYGEVAGRAGRRFANQVEEVMARHASGHHTMPVGFERRDYPQRPDKIAPHECGIWFWGLWTAQQYLDKLGVDEALPTLPALMDVIAEFVFRCYWIDETGTPQLPYYVTVPWDHPPQRSASGEHFGWLAAMHYSPRTKAEEHKWLALEEMGRGLSPRWRA